MPNFTDRTFYFGQMVIRDRHIIAIRKLSEHNLPPEQLSSGDRMLLPGLIDAHIHIESAMLTPGRFAEMAVRFGTVATVSDPHEIANVCGVEGVRYMIRQSQEVPLKIHYTIPSCVPATDFETSGATIGIQEVQTLILNGGFVALGEMMNYPGVINNDLAVREKLEIARASNLPIDGHAPGVSGNPLKKYIAAGISTDHECTMLGEAKEKIELGMKILIREGSAARNFEALWPLIQTHTRQVMLCSDDLHPDDLVKHHMDELVRRGLRKGISIFDLVQVCAINPILHYKLPVGKLQLGDPADFIVVSDLKNFSVEETWIDGKCQWTHGEVQFQVETGRRINNFIASTIGANEIKISGKSGMYRFIGAMDGTLITGHETVFMESSGGEIFQDIGKDVLKVVVLNRYRPARPAVGLIKGFGLHSGAIASSIAHDSHQIIAVGASDQEIVCAINRIISAEGGICVSHRNTTDLLELPVAGLMSDRPAGEVGEAYRRLSQKARSLGSPLHAPFMTLSFMGLLVIPNLKMSDLGLFDSKEFQFVPLQV